MIVFKELEVIEYLIEKKVIGAEKRLSSYLKNHKLTNKDQINSAIEDFSMFHLNVRLGLDEKGKLLKGKDRVYVSDGEKEIVSKRITGNSTNGRQVSEEDELLKEFFFAELVRRIGLREDGWSNTYNFWGRDWINQFSVSDMEWSKFETKLKEIFKNNEKINEKMINEIFKNIKENLKKDTRSLAIKLIERLEKEDRIETEIEFFQVIAKDSYIEAMLQRSIEEDEKVDYHNEISEEMQMRIASEISEKLVPFKMSYKRYKVVSAFPQFGTPEEKKALSAIGEWLIDEYSIDYMYNSIRIFVVDPDSRQAITKKEAEKAFIYRLINKTNARMNRKDYKTTHKFQNAFYRLSMFLLLDLKNVKGLKESIQTEKQKINSVVSECVFQYALKYGEKYETEERRVYGFGETSLDKPKKKEIPETLKGHDLTNLFEDKPEKVGVMKEVKPANWIDIASIPTEDEPEVVEVKANRDFADMVAELDRAREEKRVNKLDSSLMPKSGEAKFKITGYNITELSLRGIGS